MRLEDYKKKVYNFFDSDLKPLIMNKEDDVVEKCRSVAEKKMPNYRWEVRQYENTVRVSAWISGLNYLCFMVATPDGEEEYDFGTSYYGAKDENSSNN